MKKLLSLFILINLYSCSNSDDSNSLSNSDFHPPTWIQGNWEQKGALDTGGVLFSFSANDFCLTNLGINKQCHQEFVNQIRKSGNTVTVTETITSTKYTAEIAYYGGQSLIYSFKKLSNISIEWTSVPGSEFIKQ